MAKFETVVIGAKTADLHDNIQVALANIPVSSVHIESSYLGRPNLSRDRLKLFNSLLNDISRYRGKCNRRIDLVIFPEVSVPHAWEPMLVAWARKHRIGVVCGLEHHINTKKQALNEILAALPYQTDSGHWACIPIRRVKRFYSPGEEHILTNEGLKVPNKKEPYHLFRWRGASFTIYNCFELASIEDRSLFKGKVDFIVASEFNRDVNYFSNVVEAAARDLHCYVVQVNDSSYGDSRIVTPSKSEMMNPLRIKGGDNLTFLTMTLNLTKLRTHQRKGYGLQKESKDFKPTPPGFSLDDVNFRINLGNQK